MMTFKIVTCVHHRLLKNYQIYSDDVIELALSCFITWTKSAFMHYWNICHMDLQCLLKDFDGIPSLFLENII